MKGNKKFVIDANFIKQASLLNLELNEFLLLIYFDNSDECIIDFNLISNKLKIKRETVLEAFNNLLTKNLITIVSEKNESGKRYDRVSLDNFYNGIKETRKKEETTNLKKSIFSIFESEFKRPLSGMEYEIIKAWCEKMYNEELILAALKEAVYNGATNIRYIDTILHEWNKKGFKTKEDIDNYFKNRNDFKKLEDTSLFEYNWLEDYDK